MSKPRLPVTTVFVVEECLPYDGCTILGVYTSFESAKAAHPGRWKQHPSGTWNTQGRNEYAMFLNMSAHDLRP